MHDIDRLFKGDGAVAVQAPSMHSDKLEALTPNGLYEPDFHPRAARAMAHLGATNQEIADGLSIGLRTLYRWCVLYPEFKASVKVGKDAADDRVEASLYAGALGFYYEKQHVVKVKDQDGNEEVEIHSTMEYHPPDHRSQALWLRARRPDEWKDEKDLDAGKSLRDAASSVKDKLQRALIGNIEPEDQEDAKPRSQDGVQDAEFARVDG